MNSVESYKSFITFLILAGILILSILGFNLIFRSSNQNAKANEPKETQQKLPNEQTQINTTDTTPQNIPLPDPIIAETEQTNIVQDEETVPTPMTIEEKSQPDLSPSSKPAGETDQSPIKEIQQTNPDNSFPGFEDPIEYNSNTMVLGKSTNQLSQNQIKEFKDAMKFQDLRYDINRDAIVDVKDYPLYISFINNPED